VPVRVGVFEEFESDSSVMIVLEGEQRLGDEAAATPGPWFWWPQPVRARPATSGSPVRR
jgi:hypothetical protein